MSGIGKGGPKRARKIVRDSILGITKDAIHRLAHRAGAKRLSELISEETRGIMKVTLENLLKDVITFTEHEKMRTVQGIHVRQALELRGIDIPIGEFDQVKHRSTTPDGKGRVVKVAHKLPGTVKRSRGGSEDQNGGMPFDQSGGRRFRPGTVALRKIRHYQKHTGFIFPAVTFERLVREIGSYYKMNLRFSTEALRLIQYYLEDYLVDLFSDAVIASIHARRTTVQPKDLQIARRIRDERA